MIPFYLSIQVLPDRGREEGGGGKKNSPGLAPWQPDSLCKSSPGGVQQQLVRPSVPAGLCLSTPCMCSPASGIPLFAFPPVQPSNEHLPSPAPGGSIYLSLAAPMLAPGQSNGWTLIPVACCHCQHRSPLAFRGVLFSSAVAG